MYFLEKQPGRPVVKLSKFSRRQIKAGYNSRPGTETLGRLFNRDMNFARPLFEVGFYSSQAFRQGITVYAELLVSKNFRLRINLLFSKSCTVGQSLENVSQLTIRSSTLNELRFKIVST